jgi:DNA-binding SARP family transcriptional activator
VQLEFRVLGPLEVRGDDGPLALGGAKQRALLALLVLNAGRVVPRERIVDALWGEAPPESAVKGIQLYVWQLRKLLPEGAIVTRPGGYILEADGVDLVRFERDVADARSASPEVAARVLGAALALWRGPPLIELADKPFFRAEAARLEELRLAALEDRIDADLALGQHAKLVGELEALIAERPHRERLRGQLMLALYRSGRQADALEAYRDARAALNELGLEPAHDLRDLERRILTHDQSLGLNRARSLFADDVPLPGPLVPEPAFPFVGRSGERETLSGLLGRASAGEGCLVLLGGEAGGGKTRLIRELAREAVAAGAFVLYGVSDAAVATPYQPLREWLEFLLRSCEPAALRECFGPGGRELARLVPELSLLVGEPPVERRDVENERFVLQGAVVELLLRLSVRLPLLVVADDVHWADAETLQLLRRLARSAPEARWLLVAAYRGEEASDEVAETVGELGRLEAATRLTLGNLSEEEVGEFVRRSTDAEASAELVSALGELSDCTPLLLCELWRDLSERGGIEVRPPVRLVEPLAGLRGPQRVGELVRQRLARLEPGTVALLELAAVAGPQFELRLLTHAASTEPAGLGAAVEEAVRCGMIEELTNPAFAHRFGHELVRRAIYDRLTAVRRAQLHARVAEALETIHASDPSRVLPELAHHFTLAAPVVGPERGVDYNVQAGESAVAVGTLEQAAECFERALALGITDGRRRVQLELELASVLRGLLRTAAARKLAAEARETATRLGDRSLIARARLGALSSSAASHFGSEEWRRDVEDVILDLTDVGDDVGLSGAWFMLAQADRRHGRVESACAALERALVHADAAGNMRLRSSVISDLMHALCAGPTPVGDAIRRCEELRLASRGQPVVEAIVERALSLLSAMAARRGDARKYELRAGAVLDQLDDRHSAFLTRVRSAADAQLLLGNVAASEQHLLAGWERYARDDDSEPDRYIAALAASKLAMLNCDLGRWDEAARWLSPDKALSTPYAELVLGPAALARLTAHRDEPGEALTLARTAVEIADESDLLTLKARVQLGLAEVLTKSGQGKEADIAVETAIVLYENKGNVAAAARLRGTATSAPVSTRRPSR